MVELPMMIWAKGDQVAWLIDLRDQRTVIELFDSNDVADLDVLVIATYLTRSWTLGLPE